MKTLDTEKTVAILNRLLGAHRTDVVAFAPRAG